ncbi:MAG: methyltransferase domain-containing protein [Blastocatellia bacterium]|nr:methyltransferase domain-containing protein [Blastocatellia bacterium]
MRRCLSCDAAFVDQWTCRRCSFTPPVVDGYLSFAPQLVRSETFHNPIEFAALAKVEAGNFWFRGRNRLIVWAIRRYFPQLQKMLEIGCGTGYVLAGVREAFPEITLSGSEVSCVGLNFAERRARGASLFQIDARNIPFRDEFDVIGAFDVLEHVHDDEQVLREMWAAVRTGGGIIVTVPQHTLLWSMVDEVAGHVRRYRARDLVEKISRTGFKVVRVTSFVSLLLPPMMVSRLRQRKAGSRVAQEEFALGRFANSILERILDMERGLIRLGVSFPVGGSLLVVAVKQEL